MTDTAARGPGGGAARRRRFILATTMLSATIYSMNLTIVSISLPHMQGTFSATPDQISWVITAFIVGMTTMIIGTGWISNRFGRKNVFILSILFFVATSLMCGNAGSLEEEVLWRLLQGIAGAPLIPLSQAIVVDAYPRGEHAKAIGYWAIGGMVGPIVAPPIGGFITELYGWPSVFYINLPVGALALLGAIFALPRIPAVRNERLDWFGLSALIIALGAFQLMLNRGARLDWLDSPEIVVELTVAGVFIYIFAIHAITGRETLIKRELFRDWNYTFGLMAISMFGGLVFLQTILIPLILKNLAGYPVDTIGLVLAPRALGVVMTAAIMGPATKRVDPRILSCSGFATIAVSAYFMAQWSLDVGPWDVVWTGFLQGVGSNLVFVPLNTMAFSTLPARFRTEAVPIFYLVLNLGASIGIATIMTYWSAGAQEAHAILVENITPFNEALRGGEAAGLWDRETGSGIAAINAEISRQARMISYNNTFYLISAIALAGMVPILLLRWARVKGPGQA